LPLFAAERPAFCAAAIAAATWASRIGGGYITDVPLIVDSGNTFNSNSVVAGALGPGLCGPSSSFPGCGGAPGTAGSGSDGGPGGTASIPDHN
jgi:hypothetical protein